MNERSSLGWSLHLRYLRILIFIKDKRNLLERSFDELPSEIKQLIFSFTNLNLATALRLQAVSSEFKYFCWIWMREFDTSGLIRNENTTSIASQLFKRVNPKIIRRLDLSHCENAVAIACKIMMKFPCLQRIDFGFQAGSGIEEKLPELEKHPKLCEISLGLDHWYWTESTIRCVIQFDKCVDHLWDGHLALRNPTVNYSLEQTPFIQQDPIHYNRAYHRGGTIGRNMHVIGATDGTLTFLTLDTENKSLVHHSTNHVAHKDCINAIWCATYDRALLNDIPNTYIASSDGIVTSWSCENNKPVLKQTLTFPESILFVCDHADKYVLAAGKRTLYIAEIDTNKIVRELRTEDDIVGLFANKNVAVLSTNTTLYDIKLENSTKKGIGLIEHSKVVSSNLWFQYSRLRVSVQENAVVSTDHKEPSAGILGSNFAYGSTFDTRPHLIRYSPKHFWMAVSTGTYIVIYKQYFFIASVSPRISRQELNAGNFPTCNSLWYSVDGTYLFGLYSNNALYWWEIVDKSDPYG